MLGSWQGVNGRKRLRTPGIVEQVKKDSRREKARPYFSIYLEIN